MKNSTRKTITFLIIVLGLAACTPASTPPVDTGQEEQAPTLTLSPTETPLPTETLTPTVTTIPPTPTFPAPEGADLPDSAVRSVNDQGQEVILDQPGGEVLWTLVEDENRKLEWQKSLSEEEAALLSEAQAKFDAMAADLPYSITAVLSENEKVVGTTPYDLETSPYCSYQQGEVVVHHFGRAEMEAELYPTVTEERNIWQYLSDFDATWNQELMSYQAWVVRAVDDQGDKTGPWQPATEGEGELLYWQPKMGESYYADLDVKGGWMRVTQIIKSDDVELVYMLSADHPYVKSWKDLDGEADGSSEEIHRRTAEMYVAEYGELIQGKKVIIRVSAYEPNRSELRGDVYFLQSGAVIGNASAGGYQELDNDTALVTVSIDQDTLREGMHKSFTSQVHWATLWALAVKQALNENSLGKSTIEARWKNKEILNQVLFDLADDLGISTFDTVEVILK